MPVRDIAVVGFSAGGIDPLLRLVEALPADFPGAVFVVHHFPPPSVSAREAEHGSNILRQTLRESPVREPLDAEAEPETRDMAAVSRGLELA